MKKITNRSIDRLLRGASLLSCGGGLPYPEQQRLIASEPLSSALKNGIELLPPHGLPGGSSCATVSEVGSADAPVMDKSQLPEALALLEAKTGKKITALIPGEIGQESIVLSSAAMLGLPVVDADLSGCRAVPRLSDLALSVRGIPFTMSPFVIILPDGRITFIPKQKTLADDEERVRSCVPKGAVVTILGACVSSAMIRRYLAYESYTKALRLGLALERGKQIHRALPTPCIFGPIRGKIVAIKERKTHGFTARRVVFSVGKTRAIIEIENEYMKLTCHKQEFAFPQLIMLLSDEKKRGIHSSELQRGMRATVMVADAFDFWKKKEAL